MAGIWGGYALSLAISDLLIFLYLRISHKTPDSMFYHLRPMFKFGDVKDSLKTGLPEMLCWAYYILSAALRNGLVIRIGNKAALAAVTLSDGAEFGELVMTAVFYAVLVTIGEAYGSHDKEKYHAYISTVAKSVLKIAIIGGIIFMLTAWPILNIFIEEGESQEVFNIALKILVIYGFNFIFYIITSMFSSLYETIGLLKYAHLNYLLEVVFYAVLMVTLGFSIGVDGIWYAQPIAEILLLFFNLWLVWKSCGHFPRKFADFGFDREIFEFEQG
jgi:Na+-driven multidrug efflux pump